VIGAVVFYSLMIVAVTLMLIERRVGRKPENEQSERQKRFMDADLAAGRALRGSYTQGVHITSAVLGSVIVVVGLVRLVAGDLVFGISSLVGGVVAASFGIHYLVTASRHSNSGDDRS